MEMVYGSYFNVCVFVADLEPRFLDQFAIWRCDDTNYTPFRKLEDSSQRRELDLVSAEEHRLYRLRALQRLSNSASASSTVGRNSILLEVIRHHWTSLWSFRNFICFCDLAGIKGRNGCNSFDYLLTAASFSRLTCWTLRKRRLLRDSILLTDMVPGRKRGQPAKEWYYVFANRRRGHYRSCSWWSAR